MANLQKLLIKVCRLAEFRVRCGLFILWRAKKTSGANVSALKVEREENNIRSIPFANFYSFAIIKYFKELWLSLPLKSFETDFQAIPVKRMLMYSSISDY